MINSGCNIFELLAIVKKIVVTYNKSMRLEQKVAKLLKVKQKTLATAESCSGGLLGHRITNIPGSSIFYLGGIIAYNNSVKLKSLNVPGGTLKTLGAVSKETALAMAKGIRKKFKANYGLSITGIAGPTGGTKQKPIGLTYVAVATDNGNLCLEYFFKGTRSEIKQKAATQALQLLLEFL